MRELSANEEEQHAEKMGHLRLIRAQTAMLERVALAQFGNIKTSERSAINADFRVYRELSPSTRPAWLISWHDRQRYINKPPGRRA